MMMHSTNQKCNLMQSAMGIFFHSCNTPQKVIQTFACIGCSISHNSINAAIKSLSAETWTTLRVMGQSLNVSYTYDNFNIDFQTDLPTVEKSGPTLTHLTSGTLVHLEHGVTASDLRCSAALWATSPLNPRVDIRPILRNYPDFLKLHPEVNHPSGLSRRARFNAWIFFRDLVTCGPAFFSQFKATLPEFVEKIPVVKMRHVPARSMDVNESKVSGNIQAISNLLDQGSVGDLNEYDSNEFESGNVSISEHVVLIFADRATGERVDSLLDR
jgi:hypothetical protein